LQSLQFGSDGQQQQRPTAAAVSDDNGQQQQRPTTTMASGLRIAALAVLTPATVEV